MGKKFEGILICTDLDGTLLTTGDKRLTEENKKAIEYFMQEGGYFTYATGRMIAGIRIILDQLKPNAPIVCSNGGTLYDVDRNEIIWGEGLDKDAIKVVEFIEERVPEAGIEICTDNKIYFSRENRMTKKHMDDEELMHNSLNYKNVFSPWKKVLFAIEECYMAKLQKEILYSEFANKYTYVKSDDIYFEILPKGMNKGKGVLKLAEVMGIKPSHVIAVGDNYNDIEMVKNAGVGIAVANAVPELREAADIITVDNNRNALAAVITSLEIGSISFKD